MSKFKVGQKVKVVALDPLFDDEDYEYLLGQVGTVIGHGPGFHMESVEKVKVLLDGQEVSPYMLFTDEELEAVNE